MSDYVIKTEKLSKEYNGKAGCKDITLQVPRGVVYGFIGPNGAGKSTFVRTLLGLLRPTGGKAQMLGKPIGHVKTRRKIGYLPELFRYPDWLTGLQLLHMHADILGIKRSQRRKHFRELLDRVNLTGRENEKIGKYSKGMQQRIGLACALLGDPELIFLDEPTSALDPIGRLEVRNLLSQLRREGKTVFLNSHLLMEIEQVCDQVAIINKGELVVQGDWRKLSEFNQRYRLLASSLDSGTLLEFPAVITCEIVQREKETAKTSEAVEWQIEVNSSRAIPLLIKHITERGGQIYGLTPVEPHLEEIFVYWVNRKEQKDADNRQDLF